MRRAAAGVLATCVAAALLARPVAAAELDSGDLHISLNGHLRSLYVATRAVDSADALLFGSTTRRKDWSLLTRVRTDLEFAFRDRLSAEVVYDVEMLNGTTLDSLGFVVAEGIGTRTWLDADRTFSRHENLVARDRLYRGWVRYEDQRLEVTLGRQRIPLGRGRLWNPTDLFNPIFPLQIQGDQRIGQDAALGRLRLREELWASVIWSPQDDPDDHRLAWRIERVDPELDAAFMVGNFARDWVFGLDFARNLGEAAIRGEATFTNIYEGDRIWQAVASIDYTFPVGSGLYGLIEHLYNENRIGRPLDALLETQAPGPPPPVLTGTLEEREKQLQNLVGADNSALIDLDRITSLVALNQTGFQLSYEFNPIFSVTALAIYDWSGPSVAFFPVTTITVRDDLVLTLGTQLFYGPDDRSEFGNAANLFFVQLDAYF